MNEISKEYGTALFMLACEKDAAASYYSELEKVNAAFEDNPEYIKFLASPSIPKSERLGAIESAFSDVLCEDVVSFIMLLCEKGRITAFGEATKEFKNLLDASNSVKTAIITSAVELTENEKLSVKEKLESKTKSIVNMKYFIDESLLGGMIIEIDGKIMDGSLKSRLHDIKEVIST